MPRFLVLTNITCSHLLSFASLIQLVADVRYCVAAARYCAAAVRYCAVAVRYCTTARCCADAVINRSSVVPQSLACTFFCLIGWSAQECLLVAVFLWACPSSSSHIETLSKCDSFWTRLSLNAEWVASIWDYSWRPVFGHAPQDNSASTN